MPPLVSVVLPVRDGARFLAEAVDSVLAQTHLELELVVVDDGSTDETADLVSQYRDDRIRLLRQERAGITEALNRGIGASRGAYLARMDADDISLPERLERQVSFLERHPRVALVAPGVELVDAAGRRTGTLALPGDDAALRRRLLLRNPITHGAVAMRRDAVERAGGYIAKYGSNEDYDLWRRLAREWELAAIPDVLYRYRVHRAAVTQTDAERVDRREELRAELWREPMLVASLWGERDRAEARALLREAVRRRRVGLAARVAAGHLVARVRSR